MLAISERFCFVNRGFYLSMSLHHFQAPHAILLGMKNLNIAFVGHVCIDQNKTEQAEYTDWGSPAIYMAEYLRSQKHHTSTILTSYGPDLLPHLPDVHLLPKKPNRDRTLIYENNTRQFPRTRKVHNAESSTAPTLTAESVKVLESADIVIVAVLLPNYPRDFIEQLLQHIPSTALKVLYAQGYLCHVTADGTVVPHHFAEAPQIVPRFDITIMSEEDHPQAFRIAQDWLHNQEKGYVIVTQGEQGASIVTPSTVRSMPTTPIPESQIIDSVGCGDIFSIATACAFYESHNIEQAVRRGHQAASRKLLSSHTPVV